MTESCRDHIAKHTKQHKHTSKKEKHNKHLNQLENDIGSFYLMVCFFESAVCNGEGGRLKGFQLIPFHNVLSLPLIFENATDSDDAFSDFGVLSFSRSSSGST